MVLRLNRRSVCLIIAAGLAALFCLPYFCSDLLALEHDTLFHLSRIEGLSEAIRRGDFLPALYPYKNNGFGYASPLFYCDILLIPFSLLLLAGLPLSWCYKLLIFCATMFSTYAVLRLLARIVRNPFCAVALSTAFCFSSYRITDVYVRGAVGEMMAIGFLAVVITGLRDLLESDDAHGGWLLYTGLCGLIFSHNLTFLFGAVSVVLITAAYIDRISAKVFRAGVSAVLGAFLTTAWFTLPMMEQLHSQEFILHYYAGSSQLERYAMPLWKYFAEQTVFGYGENDIARDRQMIVNIGLAVTALSLLYPFTVLKTRKSKPARFETVAWVLGMVCLILPWDRFPWASFSALRVLQFPWRLMTPALILLLPAAAVTADRLFHHKQIPAIIFTTLLLCEGIWHLIPAFNRPFGITSDTTWQMITSGELIDPYYSATYMRVELAGGDYLPIDSPDFRTEVPAVRDQYGSPLDTSMVRNGAVLTISLNEVPEGGILELPLTFYKGYACTVNGIEVPVQASDRALVRIQSQEPGTIRVWYRGTVLRRICIPLSLLAAAGILFLYIKKTAFR